MNNKQTILGINTYFEPLDYSGLNECAISEHISYMDYDAIIIDTENLTGCYKEENNNSYKNKRLLTKASSIEITEDFQAIRQQIIDILKQGKNLFVILGNNKDCYIYTGKKSGKNAGIDELNVYSFLPINISTTHIYGEKMDICSSSIFSDFFKKTSNLCHYEAYFIAENILPLINIKNSDKVVSAVCKYENGHIVFLPRPNDEEYYENMELWNNNSKIYLDALFELNKKLSASLDKYELPNWANHFTILAEEQECEKLNNKMKAFEMLKIEIEKQKEVISDIKKYKALITSTGKPLEEITKYVLNEIGFQILKSEVGRSDVIANYKNKDCEIDIVAEIKGVTKSAAEKHAAQLEKWVAQFIEENERLPKALLIVNAYCDLPVFERIEDVFPNQMLKYCESRGHALISTTQLLCLFIDIKNNPDLADEKINELLNTVGVYNKYTDLNAYLKPLKQEENDV